MSERQIGLAAILGLGALAILAFPSGTNPVEHKANAMRDTPTQPQGVSCELSEELPRRKNAIQQKTEDWKERKRVIQTMPDVEFQARKIELLQSLDTPDKDAVRYAILVRLLKEPTPDVISVVARLIRFDSSKGIRQVLAADSGSLALKDERGEVMSALAYALQYDTDEQVRINAAWSLSSFGEAGKQALSAFVSDGQPEAVAVAVRKSIEFTR